MTNHYPGRCVYCRGAVPGGTGKCLKVNRVFVVAHNSCYEAKGPAYEGVMVKILEEVLDK